MFRPSDLFLPAAVLLLGAAAGVADDWPQWLGPQRDGVWREDGVVTEFPADGPQVAWRVPVGGGYAGPAVAGGRVFLTDWTPRNSAEVPDDPFQARTLAGAERVLCLDAATGDVVWEHRYPVAYTIQYPAGPRVTPTVEYADDGTPETLYTLGAMGDLLALDAADGTVRWSVNFPKDHGTKIPVWGFASHPLVDGDRLIVIAGPADGAVVALDKNTGKTLWSAGPSKEPGYAPPVIRTVGGTRQVVAWTAENVHGLDPETGDAFWTVPLAPSYGMSIAHPVPAGGNSLFCMCHDLSATAMLTLGDDGKSAAVEWTADTRHGMHGVMCTPVVEEGVIYSPDRDGRYTAATADTGDRLWQTTEPVREERVTWGNTFTVPHPPSGTHFFASEDGTLKVGRLSKTGYEELSSAKILDPTQTAGNRKVVWVHPAFAMKSVFWRNDRELVRVDLAD